VGKYIAKRIIGMIPTLFFITIFVFLFIHFIPGDPARLAAGLDASEQTVAQMRQQLGLNEPLIVQYKDFLVSLFTFNFGDSLRTHQPVTVEIGSRFMPTLLLSLASLFWAIIFGLLIGVFSARNRNTWKDHLGMILAVAGISIPSFWLGLMLMQYFSVRFGWFPTGGMGSGWRDYVLPSLTLGMGTAAVVARFTRSSMIEVSKENYLRLARAKGLTERSVVYGHGLRNALIPIVTMIGLQMGFMLGGSVVVETIFNWPGVGRLLIDSVSYRDYTVIRVLLLLFSVEFLVINLIVDVLYGLLNPKIRFEK
jgi:glutathione transport system permease protein